MRKTLLTVVSILYCCNSFSQNMVLNGDFESYITCPGFGQFGLTWINNWTKPTYGSTDYYHSNCPAILPTQQTPHSGSGYCGLIAFNFGTEYREYATGELTASLIPGGSYDVQFWVSLNDGYIQAVDELGAYLSASVPGPYPNALHIPVAPQIQNTSGTLSSTVNWMPVSGTFIATGGEQYITIGNFNNDSNTTVTQVGNTGSYGAYYFVDDVSVTPHLETVEELSVHAVSVYPNPFRDVLFISTKKFNEIAEVSVFDITGRKVETEFKASDSKINFISETDAGIYLLKVRFKDGTLSVQKIFRSEN